MTNECLITSITITSANFNDGCHYCGQGAECWDHIISKHLGGDNSIENLIPSCNQCNSSKWKRSLSEWRKFLREQQKHFEETDVDITIHSEFETPDPYQITGKRHLSMNGGFIKFESDDGKTIIEDLQEYAGHYPPYQDKNEDAWIQAITKIFKTASQIQNA